MISRRRALGLLGGWGVAATSGCAPPRAHVGMAPAATPPLRLGSLTDLVPAAEVVWLVQVNPQAVLADPVMSQAVSGLVPPARFGAFAARHAGIDLRSASEIVVAGFPQTTLVLTRIALDAARVERTFAERAVAVEGRASERGITRLWGTVDGLRTQLALFGRQAVGIEVGRFAPLRAAEYFALGRLQRSLPALRALPLESVASRLGDAPVRCFAAGPFTGEWGRGFAGLLSGATAIGTCVRRARDPHADALTAFGVMAGAWGEVAAVAAERLDSSFRIVAEDPLGRLTGLDRPITGPDATGSPDALTLEVTVDPVALIRGLHAAIEGTTAEIFGS
jgi:hypothetical protein